MYSRENTSEPRGTRKGRVAKETYYIQELHVEEPEKLVPPIGYETRAPQRALPARYEPARMTPKQRRRKPSVWKRIHPVFYIGIGVFAVALLFWIVTAVSAGLTNWNNDRLYGMPRTAQYDQVVGHGDSREHPTHFVVVNLNHQAVITEYPGGGAAKATYISQIGIAGPGSENVPVTLSFQDANGDGKIDMLVHVLFPEREQYQVFINTGSAFRPATNNDKLGGQQ